jgi:hypothetical protein
MSLYLVVKKRLRRRYPNSDPALSDHPPFLATPGPHS